MIVAVKVSKRLSYNVDGGMLLFLDTAKKIKRMGRSLDNRVPIDYYGVCHKAS